MFRYFVDCLQKSDEPLTSAAALLDPALTAAAAAAATTASEQPAANARHTAWVAAACLDGASHPGAVAAAARTTPLGAAKSLAVHTPPASEPGSQGAATPAVQAAVNAAGPHVKTVDHLSTAAAATPNSIKLETNKLGDQSGKTAAAAAATPDVICIDVDSDDDDHDKSNTELTKIKVKQEEGKEACPEDQAADRATAGAERALVASAQGTIRMVVAPAALDTAMTASGTKAAGHVQQVIPMAAGTAVVQQQLLPPQAAFHDTVIYGTDSTDGARHNAAVQAQSAEAEATTAQQPSSVAAVSPARDMELQLPADFTLADCDDDILTAGRQLIKLVKHLKASDDQVEQLYACIKSFHGQHVDENRVKLFWFEYSQLQLWVERRNVNKVKCVVQQLLLTARFCAGG